MIMKIGDPSIYNVPNPSEPPEMDAADWEKALDIASTELARVCAENEELRRELDEARQMAGLGCDAADGGPHSIIKDGSYQFCRKCGETITAPKLRERVRKAEAENEKLRREADGMRARDRRICEQRDMAIAGIRREEADNATLRKRVEALELLVNPMIEADDQNRRGGRTG